MTELGGGLETFGYAEFPFQPLPLIPVSVQMIPVMVCLAFHLIALTVTQQSSPVTVQSPGIGMIGEFENILLQGSIKKNFTMHTVVMVVFRAIGMLGIVPTQGTHIFVYSSIIFSH